MEQIQELFNQHSALIFFGTYGLMVLFGLLQTLRLSRARKQGVVVWGKLRSEEERSKSIEKSIRENVEREYSKGLAELRDEKDEIRAEQEALQIEIDGWDVAKDKFYEEARASAELRLEIKRDELDEDRGDFERGRERELKRLDDLNAEWSEGYDSRVKSFEKDHGKKFRKEIRAELAKEFQKNRACSCCSGTGRIAVDFADCEKCRGDGYLMTWVDQDADKSKTRNDEVGPF